jgi:hypothetical protein
VIRASRIKRINNECGSLTLELILAAGILAAVVTAGLGAIRWQLESNMKRIVEDQVWLDLESLRKSVEYAWDQRCSHSLREGPWLEIESAVDGSDRSLQRLWILHFDSEGALLESTWTRGKSGWRLEYDAWHKAIDSSDSRAFKYDGRIWINSESATYTAGESPLLLQFSFPDVPLARLRQGFAIRRIW